jgi:hypothetical protein
MNGDWKRGRKEETEDKIKEERMQVVLERK